MGYSILAPKACPLGPSGLDTQAGGEAGVILQEEEPSPSGYSTKGVESNTGLQKDLLPRAAALFLASNPSINGAWWSQRLLAA